MDRPVADEQLDEAKEIVVIHGSQYSRVITPARNPRLLKIEAKIWRWCRRNEGRVLVPNANNEVSSSFSGDHPAPPIPCA